MNPQAAREATFGTVPAGKKKSVLVVGGGVAGMEAAHAPPAGATPSPCGRRAASWGQPDPRRGPRL